MGLLHDSESVSVGIIYVMNNGWCTLINYLPRKHVYSTIYPVYQRWLFIWKGISMCWYSISQSWYSEYLAKFANSTYTRYIHIEHIVGFIDMPQYCWLNYSLYALNVYIILTMHSSYNLMGTNNKISRIGFFLTGRV